jgi:hypothetical protein
VLRNLYGRKFDNQEAYDSIVARQDYRDKTWPIEFCDKLKYLSESGVIYLYGRDKHLRPIIISQAQKILQLPKDIQNQDLINFILFMVEYVRKHMQIPGRIENFVMMIDCFNVGVWNLPYGMIKSLIQII